MAKISSEDYLNTKLRPIFNALTESLIKDCPDDPVMLLIFILDFVYD